MDFAKKLNEALEGQELDWVIYFIDPKDGKACQQADADWGHSWTSGDGKGVFFSLYGPNHIPDIQEYSGEHRGDYELVDASETMDGDEIVELLEKVWPDPAVGAAGKAAADFHANYRSGQDSSYKIFGSGKVRI